MSRFWPTPRTQHNLFIDEGAIHFLRPKLLKIKYLCIKKQWNSREGSKIKTNNFPPSFLSPIQQMLSLLAIFYLLVFWVVIIMTWNNLLILLFLDSGTCWLHNAKSVKKKCWLCNVKKRKVLQPCCFFLSTLWHYYSISIQDGIIYNVFSDCNDCTLLIGYSLKVKIIKQH